MAERANRYITRRITTWACWSLAATVACGPADSTDTPTHTDPPPCTDCDTAPPDTGVELPTGTVTVDANPRSTLSRFVSWDTDQPADSRITVRGPDHSFEVVRSDLVTEHRVLVIGLHAQATFDLEVRSEGADGYTWEGSAQIQTGPLPRGIPAGAVGTRDVAAMQPGWTLMNITSGRAGLPPTAVMYDDRGRPVWYATHGTAVDKRGDVDVSLIPGRRLLMGPSGAQAGAVELDMSGGVVWDGPYVPAPNFLHHHMERQPDGTTVGLQARRLNGQRKPDEIVQWDADLNVVYRWSALEIYPPSLVPTGDLCHANTVVMELERDRIYLNCRSISTLFALSASTGQIDWAYGMSGQFLPDPVHPDPWPRNQHAPQFLPGGTVLYYDNGGEARPHSRVIEVRLDEVAMTSHVVWEFPGEAPVDPWYTSQWYSDIWGSADRLENGNTLVGAGTNTAGQHSRVFEVSPAGEVVWAMELPWIDGHVVGLYRADRVEPPY